MTSDDYKSVDEVKQALGSIARLGRAYCVGSVYKQWKLNMYKNKPIELLETYYIK